MHVRFNNLIVKNLKRILFALDYILRSISLLIIGITIFFTKCCSEIIIDKVIKFSTVLIEAIQF